jgi:internalin A
MLIIGRFLLIGAVVALIGEAIYAYDIFQRLERTPREPIVVGKEVEAALRESSSLTKTIDTILSSPIDAPVPADRMPPPLPPTREQSLALGKKAAAAKSTATPVASVVSDANPETIAPAPPPRPEQPEAPMPRQTESDPVAKVEPVHKDSAPVASTPAGPPLETLPDEAAAPTVAKSEMKPPIAVAVATNVPKSENGSPFAPPAPRLEGAVAQPPKFVRPELGPVTVDPARAANAVERLTKMGAAVSQAIDRDGRELPGRFAVTLDPNPNGDGLTRLGPQLQNQLGRALADLGDSLHTLRLRNLGLGNLSSLSNGAGLVSLDLTGSNFLNINPLTRLPRLEVADFSRTHVDNMVLAAQMRNLRVLNLSSAGVTDIAPLAALEGLEELYLNDTRVSSIDAVARLPRLNVLDIGGTRVADLKPISGAKSLIRLGIARTAVTDLKPLAECRNLVGLDLSGCANVRDISPIGSLARLEMLSLFDVPVESVDALSECTSLNTLELSRTKVTDIDALKNSKSLQQLYLRGLSLRSASALAELPSLRLVDLSGSTIAAGSDFAELRKSLSARNIEVRSTPAEN